MPDRYISSRETETQQSKGTISTQAYLGNTTRAVATVPPGYTETRTTPVDETSTTTKSVGDRQETRTTSGVGKTVTRVEDKGVMLKFSIAIQNRNPITRVSA